MTELADLLARPEALLSRLRVGSPEPIKLQKVVEALPGVGGSMLDAEATGALQLRIREFAAAGGLAQLRGRDIREACKVFVQGPHPLIEDHATADAVIKEVQRTERRSAVLALVGTYLDGFQAGEAFQDFARRLRLLVQGWKGRPIDPWPEMSKSVALFDPAKAPARIAGAVLASESGAARVLRSFGLDTTIRQRGGLAEAAFAAACEDMEKGRGVDVALLQTRLVEWGTDANGGMVFPKVFVGFVRALLTPWINSDPTQDHRQQLIEVLQALGGGDPRTNPSAWRPIRDQAPEAYGVLMRWLTRASVFQFFDIVDRSLAHDPPAKTMWAYRRRFWTAYLLGEEGAPQIEEAWVAFGTEGAWLAKRAAKEHSEAGLTAFGVQEDKGANHAALIMRIGDMIIVDWSHSAKCNFWRRASRGRPELYKARYPRGSLYSAIEQYSHSAPGSYSWQKTFAGIIEGRHFYSERRSWRPKLA